MPEDQKARAIVNKMMETDDFSQWLGIRVEEVKQGYCKLSIKIRSEMCNGFGITHGGVTFSLADSTLAFASNGYGRQSVALECSISFPKVVEVDDVITSTATEISLSHKIGVYNVDVHNQNNDLVASFKGTVYRTSKDWKVG